MTSPGVEPLQEFLQRHQPFASLDPAAVAAMARSARVEQFAAGELIVDAFLDPTVEMFVVIEGVVELWHDRDRILEPAAERLGPGGVFGFSSMLTERSVGPRVVAAGEVTVAAIPATVVEPALTSSEGARFLAGHVSAALRRTARQPTYSLVDELFDREPLVVDPATAADEVARRMTEDSQPCAVVDAGGHRYGLVTDAVLRRRLIVDRLPGPTPVGRIMQSPVPAVLLGDSAAEALITMLEREADFLLVVDETGELRGVVAPRDFAISPAPAGVSLHEQLRRAGDVEQLAARARQVTRMLDDLLVRGLSTARVIAVYSTFLDTLVRRAITLVFAGHAELSVDAFTWLSLGSTGRREAVPSSDVDTAAAFVDDVHPNQIPDYRAAFAEVHAVLAAAGLSADDHGTTASRPAFSRTNAQWRAAAREWMAAPAQNQGAIMASLLVDGRPIFGDPGLPAVSRVFAALRRHRGTMRLLLTESLSRRAKLHSMIEVLTRRAETFDMKTYAILPTVNLARWAALSVGSSVLSTTARLRVAAGSPMLPSSTAENVIEAFDLLQRLRLRYQLLQAERGERFSNVVRMDRLSPIDRSMLTQAVREVAAAQRRMDNVSLYVPIGEWTSRAGQE